MNNMSFGKSKVERFLNASNEHTAPCAGAVSKNFQLDFSIPGSSGKSSAIDTLDKNPFRRKQGSGTTSTPQESMVNSSLGSKKKVQIKRVASPLIRRPRNVPASQSSLMQKKSLRTGPDSLKNEMRKAWCGSKSNTKLSKSLDEGRKRLKSPLTTIVQRKTSRDCRAKLQGSVRDHKLMASKELSSKKSASVASRRLTMTAQEAETLPHFEFSLPVNSNDPDELNLEKETVVSVEEQPAEQIALPGTSKQRETEENSSISGDDTPKRLDSAVSRRRSSNNFFTPLLEKIKEIPAETEHDTKKIESEPDEFFSPVACVSRSEESNEVSSMSSFETVVRIFDPEEISSVFESEAEDGKASDDELTELYEKDATPAGKEDIKGVVSMIPDIVNQDDFAPPEIQPDIDTTTATSGRKARRLSSVPRRNSGDSFLDAISLPTPITSSPGSGLQRQRLLISPPPTAGLGNQNFDHVPLTTIVRQLLELDVGSTSCNQVTAQRCLNQSSVEIVSLENGLLAVEPVKSSISSETAVQGYRLFSLPESLFGWIMNIIISAIFAYKKKSILMNASLDEASKSKISSKARSKEKLQRKN